MALGRFDFRCPLGHVFEQLVDKSETWARCPQCGVQADRIFTPSANTYVPPYMRAPGAEGSSSEFCERNKIWLQGDGQKKMREQDQRIAERQDRAESSFKQHLQEAERNLTQEKVLARAKILDERQAAASKKARKVTVSSGTKAA